MLYLCAVNLNTTMNEKEIKEILRRLEDAGWQPQLCDTPLQVFESVHAGNPEEPSQIPAGMTMVPHAILKMSPEMMIKVKGNSMIDVGINDGDMVKAEMEASPYEGDIVVVAIGSDCTVKGFFVDDDGKRWIVPQNSQEKGRYRVICLDYEQERVYLCGVVREVVRKLPRVPYKAMRDLVNEAKAKYYDEPRISDQRVKAVIRMMGANIKVARQWYGVCRSMIDELLVPERQYDVFCRMVRAELPYHLHLPKEAEMQAMAVESFAKCVSKWDERNAPVKGKRFVAYKGIAEQTSRLLTMSEEEFDKL